MLLWPWEEQGVKVSGSGVLGFFCVFWAFLGFFFCFCLGLGGWGFGALGVEVLGFLG